MFSFSRRGAMVVATAAISLIAMGGATATWASQLPGAPTGADPFSIILNENGTGLLTVIGARNTGTPVTATLVGGVPTFQLPELVVPGDVLLLDQNGATSDLLRFDNNGIGGTVQFLSGDTNGELSDVGIPQNGSLGINENPTGLTLYQPFPAAYAINSQESAPIAPVPGSVAPPAPLVPPAGGPADPLVPPAGGPADPITPEPGSLALLATGGLPLLGALRRRKLAAP